MDACVVWWGMWQRYFALKYDMCEKYVRPAWLTSHMHCFTITLRPALYQVEECHSSVS